MFITILFFETRSLQIKKFKYLPIDKIRMKWADSRIVSEHKNDWIIFTSHYLILIHEKFQNENCGFTIFDDPHRIFFIPKNWKKLHEHIESFCLRDIFQFIFETWTSNSLKEGATKINKKWELSDRNLYGM